MSQNGPNTPPGAAPGEDLNRLIERGRAKATPIIYKALANVQREIHSVGIGKLRRNQEQKFNFRGIDDALMAFAPLLTENGVLLAPSYANRVIEARPTKSGGTTYNVTLEGTFTFICVEDGSTHTVGPFFGEANDGQDKAVSKATSVAERNMFFLTFVVPHEPAIGGDPDGIGEVEESLDDKAADWLRVADSLEHPSEYAEQKAKLLADYDNKPNNIPEAVRNAFNAAKARVTPKDE